MFWNPVARPLEQSALGQSGREQCVGPLGKAAGSTIAIAHLDPIYLLRPQDLHPNVPIPFTVPSCQEMLLTIGCHLLSRHVLPVVDGGIDHPSSRYFPFFGYWWVLWDDLNFAMLLISLVSTLPFLGRYGERVRALIGGSSPCSANYGKVDPSTLSISRRQIRS